MPAKDKNGKKKEEKEEKKSPVKALEHPLKDADGDLIKRGRTEFPKGAEGAAAFCQYQINYWTEKKTQALASSSPEAILEKQKKAMEKKMKKIEADLAALKTEKK